MAERRHRGPGPGPGMATGEKAKDFWGAIKDLFAYIRGYLPAIIIATVFSAAGTVLNVIGPDKMKEITTLITEGVMTGIDKDAVFKIAISMEYINNSQNPIDIRPVTRYNVFNLIRK